MPPKKSEISPSNEPKSLVLKVGTNKAMLMKVPKMPIVAKTLVAIVAKFSLRALFMYALANSSKLALLFVSLPIVKKFRIM